MSDLGSSFNNLIGINFNGYESSAYQNRDTPTPPKNYIDDSFKIFSENGLTCIRVTLYWESWELNKTSFREDLKAIAVAAEKYNIRCIYDNHQWECSSWIGSGIGFPNSLMSNYCERTKHPRQIPNYDIKKDFWDRWWNRRLKTIDGIDAWKAQILFLLEVVKLTNNNKSTFGFELLNEPAVFAISHYQKIRIYYDYLINELRKMTNKPLLFCWAPPHGFIDIPMLQALASPTQKMNTIYDCHPYPPSFGYLIYFKFIATLMGSPLYIGEFNSDQKNGTIVTQSQLLEYGRNMRRLKTCGSAIWRWSYIQDQNIPAFNMTKIINNRVQPGEQFMSFANGLKEFKQIDTR